MKRSYLLFIILFTFSLLIIALSACSRKPPEIYESYWQLIIVNDTETKQIYEKLSFFINAYDADGFDDIDKIYLIHDTEELFWEINPQTWNKSDIHGETWIGSNGVIMQNYADIPEGGYRIVLQDMSGEYDEKTFMIKRPDIRKSKIIFPKPEIKEKKLYVKGDSPVYSLWIYDRKWNFISPPFEVKYTGFDLQRVVARKKELVEGFYYSLYIYDNSIKRGIQSGPYFYMNE